jgi:hypothetical protein
LLVTLTLPAFIYLTTQFSEIIDAKGHSGVVVIILASVGVGIDLFMFIFYIVSGFSKKFHYYLSRIFNRTKQFFRLRYHTKRQTHQKYLVEGVLYKSANHYLKQ